MDGFGKDFKKNVLDAIKMESKRLESQIHPEKPNENDQQPDNSPPTLTTSETLKTLQQPDNPPPTLIIIESPNTLQQPDNPSPAFTTLEPPETLQQPGNSLLTSTTSETPKTLQQKNNPPLAIQKDKGRKIVFDNFDFTQKVHGMTEAHQNPDVHWVTHLAVENRVFESHLSCEKPSNLKLLSMENGSCLPNLYENHLQMENYILLIERVLVELPCLEFLKSYVVKHIPHQYSKEMAQKLEVVCM